MRTILPHSKSSLADIAKSYLLVLTLCIFLRNVKPFLLRQFCVNPYAPHPKFYLLTLFFPLGFHFTGGFRISRGGNWTSSHGDTLFLSLLSETCAILSTMAWIFTFCPNWLLGNLIRPLTFTARPGSSPGKVRVPVNSSSVSIGAAGGGYWHIIDNCN